LNTLDFESMREMAEANCRFLIVGFESADDAILDNIRKGFMVEKARKFAENVKKAGLLLHLSTRMVSLSISYSNNQTSNSR